MCPTDEERQRWAVVLCRGQRVDSCLHVLADEGMPYFLFPGLSLLTFQQSQIPPAQSVSTESYVSLFKVSWILTDIVQRHPQRIILEPGARHDAEVLAEVSDRFG